MVSQRIQAAAWLTIFHQKALEIVGYLLTRQLLE